MDDPERHEPIRAVLFDVAGVLTGGFTHILLDRAVELDLDIERLAEVFLPVFAGESDTDVIGHRLERGEVTLDAFLGSLGELEAEARSVLHPDSDHFFGHRLQPEQAMHDFVDEVRSAGFQVGVISNTVLEWHEAWKRAMPPLERFDVVLFSADEGVRKPNAKIYRLALERLGLEPHEALFLDDFAPMAQGGRDVGLHTVHVQNHQDAIDEARCLLGLA